MTRRALSLAAAKNDGKVHVTHRNEGSGGATFAFTLDGDEVDAREGETIWQVAQRHGTEIPHLCYSPKPGYRPDGNCRACMVEIEGERVLAASCIRTPTPGMKVKTQTDRAKTARRMVIELLLTDQPPQRCRARSDFAILGDGRPTERDCEPLRTPRRRRRPTAAIRRWRSISTPASSAISASAPAAKCRSTTSSAWPAAATARRSCSTSTIRWARRPASPAANACRPARPAR